MLNRNDRRRELHAGDPRCRVGSLKTVHRISKAVGRTKDMIWSTFMDCACNNSAALALYRAVDGDLM